MIGSERLRLLLVISVLQPGGAERVMTSLANEWARLGHEITLVTFDAPGSDPFYPIERGVHRADLNVLASARKPFKGYNSIRQTVAVRRTIRSLRPDAVISFITETNDLVILASRGLGVPVLVSDRVDPTHQELDRTWRKLRDWLYPRAAAVVVQTARSAASYPDAIRRRLTVISNPVFAAPETPGIRGRTPTVVAMGRLDQQKGFDILIRVFASVVARHSGWRLDIWGDGPERRPLEHLIHELDVTDTIALRGLTRRPQDIFASAELFALSSRYEGFPNVLCEAMAAGLPAIVFDCPSGPGEIVRSGLDGLVVRCGDVAAFAGALDSLMSDELRRLAMAARAPEVVSRFSVEQATDQWMALIRTVVTPRSTAGRRSRSGR